jgi:uncharacterized membrane protein
MSSSPAPPLPSAPAPARVDSYRFHRGHEHLATTFGNDRFALRAEAFARFFGTPVFLSAQTAVVLVWICLNAFGVTKFDVYPFILLNLAFSLQAAYAAPLILLAQTRQAARDKAHTEADARHREAIAVSAAANAARLLELLEQNTRLTEQTKQLAERVEQLTMEMHRRVVQAESGRIA